MLITDVNATKNWSSTFVENKRKAWDDSKDAKDCIYESTAVETPARA
jgi:hypothetical protein